MTLWCNRLLVHHNAIPIRQYQKYAYTVPSTSAEDDPISRFNVHHAVQADLKYRLRIFSKIVLKVFQYWSLSMPK
jgi:hypothetical protein